MRVVKHPAEVSGPSAAVPPRAQQPLRRLTAEEREARRKERARLYRQRRSMAASLVALGVLALIFAAIAQTSKAEENELPIDPNSAGPSTLLAEVSGVSVATPVRPSDLSGLGYHPEGEGLLPMKPRGKNLSANSFAGLFLGGSTPEKIQYYMMDRAGREGPETGGLDVGAEAGAPVYAPVTGVVTAIYPDPRVQDANVVEIKPSENEDLRVSVSLVQNISSDIGPKTPVTAGMTELGAVADSAEILDAQLAGYTADAGNHVTVSALQVD